MPDSNNAIDGSHRSVTVGANDALSVRGNRQVAVGLTLTSSMGSRQCVQVVKDLVVSVVISGSKVRQI